VRPHGRALQSRRPSGAAEDLVAQTKLAVRTRLMHELSTSGAMAEYTALERLLRPPRGRMDMLVGSDELELTSKGLAEAPGVVPRHLKPTATFGTIESEG
jgi:hypothetical protein